MQIYTAEFYKQTPKLPQNVSVYCQNANLESSVRIFSPLCTNNCLKSPSYAKHPGHCLESVKILSKKQLLELKCFPSVIQKRYLPRFSWFILCSQLPLCLPSLSVMVLCPQTHWHTSGDRLWGPVLQGGKWGPGFNWYWCLFHVPDYSFCNTHNRFCRFRHWKCRRVFNHLGIF